MGNILSRYIRIPLLIIGMILMSVGIVLDKWWWQIGALIVVVLFVEALFILIVLD